MRTTHTTVTRCILVIGGEGNGGIIYPELHYGRDSLVGIALFLSFLAEEKIAVSELRKKYTAYFMSKKKIELTPQLDVDAILKAMEAKYTSQEINTIDGVKIDFAENWVHLRKSNTDCHHPGATEEVNANGPSDAVTGGRYRKQGM